MKTPVLIAGAGPTGLVLALWLKKQGIAFRLVDQAAGPGETSRALAVQARTLEFYRQLGIADRLIAAGTTAQSITLHRKGQAVATALIGAPGRDLSAFPYLLFCAQDVHEKILIAELETLGVRVERGTKLTGFTQNANGVTVRLQTAAGFEEVEAGYLCGCDGAHSDVRHFMTNGFPGGTYAQVFYVADVEASGEMAGKDGLHISLSRDSFCIVMPVKTQGTVRLTGLVPRAAELKEKIAFADIEGSVVRNTGLQLKSVNWFSSYHVHHRVADRFREGRVFLAGDAGHIHSPAGGQGMNTGIGDAVNLAWKLAEVLHGRAGENLLDTYEPERMAFARVLVKTTDTAFKLIAGRSVAGAIFRLYVLPAVFSFMFKFRPIVRQAYRVISQIRIHYRFSAISRGHAGGVHAGERLPWVQNASVDNFLPLASLQWQVHVYGEVKPGFKEHLRDVSLHSFEWSKAAGRKGLLKDAMYLIRPDGYVGLANAVQDAALIREYLTGLGATVRR